MQAANQALVRARHHLAEAVAEARAQGHTWNDIGEALGMTKQAAYKRFGKPADPRTGTDLAPRTISHVTDVAEQVFTDIAAGDYDHLATLMHPRTAEELTPAAIGEVWASVLREVGGLEGFTDSHVELPGGARLDGDERALGTVVGVTTLDCEAGQVHGRVAVADDLAVVGILIVPVDHGPLPF